MSRALLLLMLGIFFTALFLGAISVYAFHDVDQDKIAHLSEAFAGLSVEAMVFSLIISGAAGPLSLLGRQLFKCAVVAPAQESVFFSELPRQFCNIPGTPSEEGSSQVTRTLFSVFIW
jgi:ABC-type Fe3+ transport system permease subunit